MRISCVRFCCVALLILVCSVSSVRAAQEKEGILLVAFGTSVAAALPAFEGLERDLRAAFPNAPLEWSYTSQIIRKKLAKEGRPIAGIRDGLAALAKQGVRVVRVVPLHIFAGAEYGALERAVLLDVGKHPQRFQAVLLARPLLDSKQDAEDVVAAVQAATASCREGGAALAVMAHGNSEGRAGLALEGARAVFHAHDATTFLASVEGERTLPMLLADLKAANVSSICLAPLMVTAGDHARNDLAGKDEDSWVSRLKAAGYDVRCFLHGLGELPAVRAVYVRHAKEAKDDLVREPVKP